MAKKKVATKARKRTISKLLEMPCYACFQDGKEVNAEVHHIRKHTGMGLRPLTQRYYSTLLLNTIAQEKYRCI
jgi:hypothetical protein